MKRRMLSYASISPVNPCEVGVVPLAAREKVDLETGSCVIFLPIEQNMNNVKRAARLGTARHSTISLGNASVAAICERRYRTEAEARGSRQFRPEFAGDCHSYGEQHLSELDMKATACRCPSL